MGLYERIARVSGDPDKIIKALRLVNQSLERELRRRTENNGQSDKARSARSMSLLKRIANSHGDRKRTIMALQLVNKYLEQRLRQYPKLSATAFSQPASELAVDRVSEVNRTVTEVEGGFPMTSRRQILIVDDTESIRSILTCYFEELVPKYQIVTARDGYEALDRFREQMFDLVLTDYSMPRMNGLELIRAVRHVSPSTAIILMTAASDFELRRTVVELGLAGFLNKPFGLAQLRELVERILNVSTHEVAA